MSGDNDQSLQSFTFPCLGTYRRTQYHHFKRQYQGSKR